MTWDLPFFLNSVLLGVGLAMDAFSVSVANGLKEPDMKRAKGALIAGTFAFFQYLMPLIGWTCVHFVVEVFAIVAQYVPYVAFVILALIGTKMIVDGVKKKGENAAVGFAGLLLQGVATSIDALSVGFTTAEYSVGGALVAGAIIAAETFGICVLGLFIGKKFGQKFSYKATIAGGIILILIGLEIMIRGILKI
ncbi:MAG: manganese efflux pump [Clostridia bacterium]|nr:manganese efflux pump [Clostridia bacterium]